MSSKSFSLESLLSARQLIHAELFKDEVYFISNISGSYSLFKMNKTGSIPIPLLPEGTALQNPHLIGGGLIFAILPKLEKIIVMMDVNGNELYQPCFIPLDGGIPEPSLGDQFKGMQLFISHIDYEKSIIYFQIDDRKNPGSELFRFNFSNNEEKSFGK